MTTTKAAKIAFAALMSNANRLWSGEVTHEQHTKINRAIWDLVEADAPAVKRKVHQMLRRDLHWTPNA